MDTGDCPFRHKCVALKYTALRLTVHIWFSHNFFNRAGDIVQFIECLLNVGKSWGWYPVQDQTSEWHMPVISALGEKENQKFQVILCWPRSSLRLTWDAVLRHGGWDKQREYYWNTLGCEILFLEVGNVISAQEIHLSSLFTTKTNDIMILQKKSTEIISKTVIKK